MARLLLRLLSVLAPIIFAVPSQAQYAWPGYQLPDWQYNSNAPPQETAAEQKTALDNAQKMLRLFSYARKIEAMSVFSEAQKQFHDTYFAYLKAAMTIAIKAKVASKPDQALLEFTLDAIEKIQSVEEFVDEFLGYQRATTPAKISAFYGRPVNAAKGFRPSKDGHQKQEYWAINEKVSVPLVYFVVMDAPGKKHIPTPTFFAKKFADKLLAPATKYLAPEVHEAVQTAIRVGLIAGAKYLSTNHVLDFGFHVNEQWLNAASDYIDIAAVKTEVYIGDPRVVKFAPWNSKLFGLSYPKIGDNQYQYHVVGNMAGEGRLVAQFKEDFTDLGFDGSDSTWPMEIKVLGPNQKMSRDVEAPMPVWSGPPTAPALPQPYLPSPSPRQQPPVAANPQPTPVGNAPPAWSPCGKPGDGGTFSPYTHKCEYAK